MSAVTPGSAVAAEQQAGSAVVSSKRWEHSFGSMLIETHADGSVWIDGKPVRDTLPQPLLAHEVGTEVREP